jgi:hypothetical protein
MSTHKTWPPHGLANLERNLVELAASVRTPPEARTDDEQIWLTRFLIVRSCGYLEQVMHECSLQHLERRSGGTARSFAMSWMSRSINPSPDNLLTLLGRFDHTLQVEFRSLLDDDNGHVNHELSALVTRRHGIAHGLNEGLGSRRALELVDVAQQVADWLILRLNPEPR